MTDKLERTIESLEVLQARVFRDIEVVHEAAGALDARLWRDYERLTSADIKRIGTIIERTHKIRAAALAADGRPLPGPSNPLLRGLPLEDPQREGVQSHGGPSVRSSTARHARRKHP
jgi:hypothetical protein